MSCRFHCLDWKEDWVNPNPNSLYIHPTRVHLSTGANRVPRVSGILAYHAVSHCWRGSVLHKQASLVDSIIILTFVNNCIEEF